MTSSEQLDDTVADAIRRSGTTIYSPASAVDSATYYDIKSLEARLRQNLQGLKLDQPLRTRSKVAKAAVASAMGYPVPASFSKTHPRFPAQNLDIFVQKSTNLQIWNEEIDPERRYAIIQVDESDAVTTVRVVTGEALAMLDKTGTLTSKFQAARAEGRQGSKLVSQSDTPAFLSALRPADSIRHPPAAHHPPTAGNILTAAAVYERLLGLVGSTFEDPGITNERGRGTILQRLACSQLGLDGYAEAGQFPDVLSQALEVKLQLSPTVDLGLVSPDSSAPAAEVGHGLSHSDCRYAVFYGTRSGDRIRLTDVVVATGQDFFSEFRRFEGLVQNRKLQIPLPAGFFDAER